MSSDLVVVLLDAHDILRAMLAPWMPSTLRRYFSSMPVISSSSELRLDFVPSLVHSPEKKMACLGAMSSCSVQPLVNQRLCRNRLSGAPKLTLGNNGTSIKTI